MWRPHFSHICQKSYRCPRPRPRWTWPCNHPPRSWRRRGKLRPEGCITTTVESVWTNRCRASLAGGSGEHKRRGLSAHGLDVFQWLGTDLDVFQWLGTGLDVFQWLGTDLDVFQWLGTGLSGWFGLVGIRRDSECAPRVSSLVCSGIHECAARVSSLVLGALASDRICAFIGELAEGCIWGWGKRLCRGLACAPECHALPR